MKRLALLAALIVSTPAAGALAQKPLPAGGNTPMPAGHPPVGSARPAPAPPPGSARPLPAGHPGVGQPAPGSRSGGGARPGTYRPPADQTVPDASIPRGTIRVEIRDPQSKPVPNAPVKLAILTQAVAEGTSRRYVQATTDAEGRAEFSGLGGGSSLSYRVTSQQGAAAYASQPFNMMSAAGYRVLLHVFPFTHDIKEALIGARGMISIVPRDDVFQFEALFRFVNVGSNTWVPQNLRLALPEGWKAFNAQESMSDVRFVADGDRGVELKGTISPGQHEAIFRFQVANEHVSSPSFRVEMPPHLMQMRVMASAARGMELSVEGFDAAQPMTSRGQRLLVADRTMRPGESTMRALAINLAGLPTKGVGRWWAVGIAVVIAFAGLGASGVSRPERRTIAKEDAKEARERLLEELVELERARRSQQIGPKTYERVRRELVQALTRVAAALRSASDGSKKKRRRRRGGEPARQA